MAERLTVKVAVYMLLRQGDKFFFLRRFNTGWMDGKLTLPSGHVDPGELPVACAVRELAEEAGVEVKPEDLRFLGTAFRKDIYVDYYFEAESFSGEAKLMEDDKASEGLWTDLTDETIIPSVRVSLERFLAGEPYVEID